MLQVVWDDFLISSLVELHAVADRSKGVCDKYELSCVFLVHLISAEDVHPYFHGMIIADYT